MKKVTVKLNQTVYDIATAEYGTCEAVGEIIVNNPGLVNDELVKIALGIDAIKDKAFYFDLPLSPGSILLIDTDSKLMKKSVIREIEKEITTFDLNSYGKNY